MNAISKRRWLERLGTWSFACITSARRLIRKLILEGCPAGKRHGTLTYPGLLRLTGSHDTLLVFSRTNLLYPFPPCSPVSIDTAKRYIAGFFYSRRVIAQHRAVLRGCFFLLFLPALYYVTYRWSWGLVCQRLRNRRSSGDIYCYCYCYQLY